jgi:uncharacterized protein YbjQ (UPF0145 family)
VNGLWLRTALMGRSWRPLDFTARPRCARHSNLPQGICMNHALTTTAFSLEGYRITKTLGVVRGITVRSRSIVGSIGAGLQTLFGGNISLYTSLCERARSDAFELMLKHAQQLGANALIGVRYDATEVMAGVTEVLCYGTAVIVESIG